MWRADEGIFELLGPGLVKRRGEGAKRGVGAGLVRVHIL